MKEAYSAKEIAEILGKTKRFICKRAQQENWPFQEETTRGGRRKIYILAGLPPDVQVALVKAAASNGTPPLPSQVTELCPLAQAEALKATGVVKEQAPPVRATSPKVLEDERVLTKIRAIQEARAVPAGWKKRKWIEAVAAKFGVSWQTLYKWMKKFEEAGPEALSISRRKHPHVWDEEALSYWIGLCLKRAHRRMSRKALYGLLREEAARRGWRIGSYHSALWHLERELAKHGKEALLAYRDGGLRALDNALTPVLRSYADLEPFEILVGDQHRFDFWVVDEETGRVFRPEGYLWQDLRTRLIYGGAVCGEHYDTRTMLLALGIGCRVFGLPQAIYTDHGKPEESRTMSAVIRELSALSIEVKSTIEALTEDEEGVLTHRKAIVRNAKAKMIERTFQEVERIMRDQLRLPGYVKRLSASAESQEVDQKEAEELARAGKLPTFREFLIAFYRALDFYNREKPHRGVHREWPFQPRPPEAKCTPMAALSACMANGFRPRRADDALLATVFLYRERRPRKVDRGLIRFRNLFYSHEELLKLSGKWVEVRYDPYDEEWILVFHQGEFVCRAEAVEYSSMKDAALAQRKIEEKRRRRKAFIELYRELTHAIPDLRQFSILPSDARPKAQFGRKKKDEAVLSEEEFQRQVAELSAEPVQPEPAFDEEAFKRELAERETWREEERPVFMYENDRYMHLLEALAKNQTISPEDAAFMARYEAKMDHIESSFWDNYCETMFGRSREEMKAGALLSPAKKEMEVMKNA